MNTRLLLAILVLTSFVTRSYGDEEARLYSIQSDSSFVAREGYREGRWFTISVRAKVVSEGVTRKEHNSLRDLFAEKINRNINEIAKGDTGLLGCGSFDFKKLQEELQSQVASPSSKITRITFYCTMSPEKRRGGDEDF